MLYEEGVLYIWLHDDGQEVGCRLFIIDESGSLQTVIQESEPTDYWYISYAIFRDSTLDLLLLPSLTWPNSPVAQTHSLYDLSALTRLWSFAEEGFPSYTI